MNPMIELRRTPLLLCVVLAPTCLCLGPASKAIGAVPAETVNVIYSFVGDADGEYADTDLETDSAGNIYGTTVLGGNFASGTVFQLSPTPNGWAHTVLYSFTGGTDGGEPYKGVTLARDGSLYGTAVTGGSGNCEGGCGVVYKLTNSGGTWTQTVIYAFSGADDGSGPGARVTVDRNGNVYGMTPTGGAYGLGTIFKLSPTQGGNWTFKILHTFTGGADGGSGSAGRMILRGGLLYGVATTGGTSGNGVVFAVRPSAIRECCFRTLYSFAGQPDGSFPYGALLFGPSGNIYGTTYYGGTNDIGAVYQLCTRPVGECTQKVLYSFQSGTDGNSPISNLVIDNTGNLYGTTSEGGSGNGAIFKVSPRGGGQWTETVVHPFQGPPDGAFPYNGMVVDQFGNFYGATVHGGANDDGSIYKFTP